MHTHDSYQADFCSVPGVEMYHLTNDKHILWGAGSRPKPNNLFEVPFETIADVDWSKFDLCLIQSEAQYFELKDAPIKKISIIHTVPYPLYNGGIYHQIKADPWMQRLVLLTEEAVLAWRLNPMEVEVINPMIDVDSYPEWRTLPDRSANNVILTVVNNLPQRNWCCGWDVWRYNTMGLPRVLVGEGNEAAGRAAIGFKSGEEVKLLMHDAAVYFNTNLHSPIGTSLLEAMAVGMPIVSTDTYAAHTFLTHSETSLNPKSAILSNVQPVLRAGVHDVLQNPEKYRKMGQAARKVARDVFDPERFRFQWQTLLEEVCG